MFRGIRITEEMMCKLEKEVGRQFLIWMGAEVDTFVCGYWSISSDKPTELCLLSIPPSSTTGKAAYYIFHFYHAAEKVYLLKLKQFLDKNAIDANEAAMLEAWSAMPLAPLKQKMYDIIYGK